MRGVGVIGGAVGLAGAGVTGGGAGGGARKEIERGISKAVAEIHLGKERELRSDDNLTPHSQALTQTSSNSSISKKEKVYNSPPLLLSLP